MSLRFVDLLYTIPPETYVFVQDLDDRRKKNSPQAKPCKAGNLKFRDIRNWCDLDVYQVVPYNPFRGYQQTVLYIQIGNKERVRRRLDIWDVLDRRDHLKKEEK